MGVYSQADNPMLVKVGNRVTHVADTLAPNTLPFDLKGGKLEPSRFLRVGLRKDQEEGAISSV